MRRFELNDDFFECILASTPPGEEAGDRHCLMLLGASRSAWLQRRHRVGRLTMPQTVEYSVMATLA